MIREYRRDLQHCYLVMYSEMDNVDKGYIRRMITENKIPGLLSCSCNRIDDKILYYYDVTSHISLKERLNQRKIEGEEMLLLLNSLLEVLNNIDEYLLPGDYICLEMDCIFVDAKMENIGFCYFPDEKEELTQSVKKLFEELLPFLNHQKSESVQIGYDIFHYLMRNPFTLEGLKEQLRTVYCNEQENQNMESIIFESEMREEIGRDSEEDEIFYEKEDRERLVPNFIIIGIVVFLVLYLLSGWYVWNNFRVYMIVWMVTGVLAGLIISLVWVIYRRCSKKSLKEEELSPIEHKEDEYEDITELLSEESDMQTEMLSEEKMKYSYILEERYTDMYRRYEIKNCEIQIIGRLHETADIVLDLPSISRVHARLRKDNFHFYLTDLNSRNGTWVNGKELVGMQEVEIEIDDEIRFAEGIYCLKKI